MRTACLAIVLGLVPALATAVPPRDANANKRAANNPAQRPGPSTGTPSLSPTARPVNLQQPNLQQANQAQVNQQRAAGNRANQPSILPANPSYRPTPHPNAMNTSNSPHDLHAYVRPVVRPPINRPDVVINRPDININRPTINRPANNTVIGGSNNTVINQNVINNVVNNNNTVVNNTVVNNNAWSNRGNNQVNNYGGYRPRPYYPQLHYHWQPTSWSPVYRPAYYNNSYTTMSGAWLAAGASSVAFANPFYVRPASATTTSATAASYDYSQPIAVPSPDYQETQDDLVRSERAVRRFDDAREVFRRGEYGRASELVDEAIALLPSDPTLHQFRALTLFARERYPDAAAALYSVLAVSPGWTRETVLKLYDTPDRYVAQVARLEQFSAGNPDAIDTRFLLAYHELIVGDLAGAKQQLEVVRIAKPTDRVVQSLLTALSETTGG